MVLANPVLEKLDEAKYFLEQMERLRRSHREFKHNLSAFLCAAWAVTGVLWTRYKARDKEAFDEWWEKLELPKDPVHQFFRKARITTAHKGPVPVIFDDQAYLVQIQEEVYTVRASGPTEFIVMARRRPPLSDLPGQFETQVVSYHWTFEKFPQELKHKNRVLQLCTYWLGKLDEVVVEALEHFGG